MITKSFLKTTRFYSILAGMILSLAFAPVHFFIAAIISLSFFYLLLERESHYKEIFWLGFFFGFGHFLSGIYWISISLLVDPWRFGWLIPFALTIIPSVLAIYIALFALCYKFCIKKFCFKETYQKILVFSLCWLVFEILRSNLLSGFPWNLLGYIWMFDLRFAQLASIFGIYGLSFFAVLLLLSPVLFWKRRSSLGDKIFAVFLLSFFIGSFVFGFITIDDKKISHNPKFKLRLVQANIKQDMKWGEDQKYKNLLKHIALTRSKSFDNVRAVIWAETSVSYVIDNNPKLLNLLKAAVPEGGGLITGGLRLKYENSERNKVADIWNSIFVVEKDGVSQHYDKHHLVPFGEYVPFYKFLSFLFLGDVVDTITGGGKGFSKGEGAKTLVMDGFSFSPLVCYEVIFSREVVNKSHFPDMFINLTNDAWFGSSSGPYQHFDMAKMRAIEYGIPLIRVAGTGVSAVIDSFGRTVGKINLNKEEVIDVDLIKSNTKPTFYANNGYIALALLTVIVFLILILTPRGRSDTK